MTRAGSSVGGGAAADVDRLAAIRGASLPDGGGGSSSIHALRRAFWASDYGPEARRGLVCAWWSSLEMARLWPDTAAATRC